MLTINDLKYNSIQGKVVTHCGSRGKEIIWYDVIVYQVKGDSFLMSSPDAGINNKVWIKFNHLTKGWFRVKP